MKLNSLDEPFPFPSAGRGGCCGSLQLSASWARSLCSQGLLCSPAGKLLPAVGVPGSACGSPAPLCPLPVTQVLPQGTAVTHRSHVTQQLNTEDTWKGLWGTETAESLGAKDLALTLSAGASLRGMEARGCSPLLKPREMQGWQGWHKVGLPHSWLQLPTLRNLPEQGRGALCLGEWQKESSRLWRITVPEWDQRGKLFLAPSTEVVVQVQDYYLTHKCILWSEIIWHRVN